MPEKENNIIRSEDFLTESKFATKYGMNDAKSRKFVNAAFAVLYKKGLHAKNPAGNLVSVIQLNRRAHGKSSRYKVPPYFEEYVLKEIEKQKTLATKYAKVVEK